MQYVCFTSKLWTTCNTHPPFFMTSSGVILTLINCLCNSLPSMIDMKIDRISSLPCFTGVLKELLNHHCILPVTPLWSVLLLELTSNSNTSPPPQNLNLNLSLPVASRYSRESLKLFTKHLFTLGAVFRAVQIKLSKVIHSQN